MHAVAELSEHGLVASGSDDCTINLWDAETGACTRTLVAHRSDVMGLARPSARLSLH